MKILAAASDRSELKAFGDGYLKVVTVVTIRYRTAPQAYEA